MVFSRLKKELSVMTPSVTKTDIRSRARSYITNHSRASSSSYHMANPNPQPDRSYKYRGVKDLGYTRYAREVDPTDFVKFGKRMFHGKQLTSTDIMEHHIQQIRANKENEAMLNESLKKQELDYVNQIHSLDQMDK